LAPLAWAKTSRYWITSHTGLTKNKLILDYISHWPGPIQVGIGLPLIWLWRGSKLVKVCNKIKHFKLL
jgi:hypothetical protein